HRKHRCVSAYGGFQISPQTGGYAGKRPGMSFQYVAIPCDCFRNRSGLAENSDRACGGLPNLENALAGYGIAKRLQVVVIDLARVHSLVMIKFGGSNQSGGKELR